MLRGTNVLYDCLTWTAATADIACCGRNNRVGRRSRGAFRQAIHTRRLRVSSTGTALVARSRRFRATGAVNAAAVSCAHVLMQSIGRRATVEESGGAVTGCRCRAWLWRCSRVTATLCGSACAFHAVHCMQRILPVSCMMCVSPLHVPCCTLHTVRCCRISGCIFRAAYPILVSLGILHAVCCVLCVLQAACCMLRAACRVLRVTS